MAECKPSPGCDLSAIREAVCIHTSKVMDACRERDCKPQIPHPRKKAARFPPAAFPYSSFFQNKSLCVPVLVKQRTSSSSLTS